jgi:formylglycine-generating enzyme required for sulfatase activity
MDIGVASLWISGVTLLVTVIATIFTGMQVYYASQGRTLGGRRATGFDFAGGVAALVVFILALAAIATIFLSILSAPSRSDMMSAAIFGNDAQEEAIPPVERSTLPLYWPQAVIAFQDPEFYDHWGFKFMEGGTLTVSERLADRLNTARSGGLVRRIQNTALAIWIERTFGKDETLWLYLHGARFGGVRGFAPAARQLFDKTPAELSLLETAQLVALLNTGDETDTERLRTMAAARAPLVLYEMSLRGFITQADREDPAAANNIVWPRWEADTPDEQETAGEAQERWTPGQVFRDQCDGCPEMVVIAGGAFMMGSPTSQADGYHTERPYHRVQIRPFAIGRYEITRGEWNSCVQANYCRGVGNGRDHYPVHNVTWQDTQDFIAWLNRQVRDRRYRLPTEAEWEYAARAGTNTQFFWGANVDNGCVYANMLAAGSSDDPNRAHCRDGHAGVAPVGRFRPNAFGLFDTTGNVWEWVEDCFRYGYRHAPRDGSAYVLSNCESRVLRGGSSGTFTRSMRVAFRGRITSDFYVDSQGFRLARDL